MQCISEQLVGVHGFTHFMCGKKISQQHGGQESSKTPSTLKNMQNSPQTKGFLNEAKHMHTHSHKASGTWSSSLCLSHTLSRATPSRKAGHWSECALRNCRCERGRWSPATVLLYWGVGDSLLTIRNNRIQQTVKGLKEKILTSWFVLFSYLVQHFGL